MLPSSNKGIGMNFGFPDVCNTIVGPATVPLPYPNLAMNAMAVPFSPLVKLSMIPAVNMGSMITTTMGDEAGTAHPMIKGPGQYIFGNPLVFIDALPGINLLCPTMGNLGNNPLGVVLMPSITTVFFTRAGIDADADADANAAAAADADADAVPGSYAVTGGRVGAIGRRSPGAYMGLEIGDHARRSGEGGRKLDWRRGGIRRHVTLGQELLAFPGCEAGPRLAMMEGGIGYAALDEIASGAASALHAGLQSLGEGGLRGLILDLRGNPGGDGHEAVRIAGAFLSENRVIAHWVDEDGDSFPYRACGRRAYDWPLCVLIDGSTASAAEVIAASLGSHGAAVLIGAASYGKRTAFRSHDGGKGAFIGPFDTKIEAARVRIVPDHLVSSGASRLPLPAITRLRACGAALSWVTGDDGMEWQRILFASRPGLPRSWSSGRLTEAACKAGLTEALLTCELRRAASWRLGLPDRRADPALSLAVEILAS